WCRGRRRLYELVVEDGVPTARRVRSIARSRTGPDPRANNFALLIVDRRSGIGVWIDRHRGGLRAGLLPWDRERSARGGDLERGCQRDECAYHGRRINGPPEVARLDV